MEFEKVVLTFFLGVYLAVEEKSHPQNLLEKRVIWSAVTILLDRKLFSIF